MRPALGIEVNTKISMRISDNFEAESYVCLVKKIKESLIAVVLSNRDKDKISPQIGDKTFLINHWEGETWITPTELMQNHQYPLIILKVIADPTPMKENAPQASGFESDEIVKPVGIEQEANQKEEEPAGEPESLGEESEDEDIEALPDITAAPDQTPPTPEEEPSPPPAEEYDGVWNDIAEDDAPENELTENDMELSFVDNGGDSAAEETPPGAPSTEEYDKTSETGDRDNEPDDETDLTKTLEHKDGMDIEEITPSPLEAQMDVELIANESATDEDKQTADPAEEASRVEPPSGEYEESWTKFDLEPENIEEKDLTGLYEPGMTTDTSPLESAPELELVESTEPESFEDEAETELVDDKTDEETSPIPVETNQSDDTPPEPDFDDTSEYDDLGDMLLVVSSTIDISDDDDFDKKPFSSPKEEEAAISEVVEPPAQRGVFREFFAVTLTTIDSDVADGMVESIAAGEARSDNLEQSSITFPDQMDIAMRKAMEAISVQISHVEQSMERMRKSVSSPFFNLFGEKTTVTCVGIDELGLTVVMKSRPLFNTQYLLAVNQPWKPSLEFTATVAVDSTNDKDGIWMVRLLFAAIHPASVTMIKNYCQNGAEYLELLKKISVD